MINKRVYYLSGFDPRGAAFYHRLFREESRKSAKITGLESTTSKRNNVNSVISQWQVTTKSNELQANIDYRFLVWDNVIRQFWIGKPLALIWASLPLYCSHFKCRLFAKFRKAGKGPYICSLYGFWFSSVALFLAMGLAVATFYASCAFYENILLNAVLAIMIAIALIKAALKLGDKIGAWWILQTYVFIARWGVKPIPLLDAKIDAFADTIIAEHLAKPQQEVLIIAHCVGAIVSIPLMARLIEKAPDSLTNKLSLITLGQCIPYLSYIPSAHHFRSDLQSVMNSHRFSWIDFGARADPLCFDEVSPTIAEGLTQGRNNYPIRHLIRPYKMFSTEKYQHMQKDKLKLHFQYLMAADIQTSYDFFEIISLPNATLMNKDFE